MISFGPQIEAPHSPDERLGIASVGRFWRLLAAFLDDLSTSRSTGARVPSKSAEPSARARVGAV
jgi:hypothetical protein